MSYRDLRNFCEILRTLGYPRLVSLENFRTPNFPLVAEILTWLVHRYDPSADIVTEIDTEPDRVIFIRSVAQFLASKAHVRVNTKRLYQADGYAVKELLKVASLLHDAMKTSPTSININPTQDLSTDIHEKVEDLKRSRQLASEVTIKGATLYDLLAKEVQLRELRNGVVARQLEIGEVEDGLRESIVETEKEIQRAHQGIQTLTVELQNYDQRIEKKTQELDRSEKRLHTLKKVRPAFMDEFEKLESELKDRYEEYLYKFRCLSFLEQQLSEYEVSEFERAKERQAATATLIEKARKVEGLDNVDTLIGSGLDEGTSGEGVLRRRQNRPGVAAGANRRVYGSMNPEGEEDSSLDSDTELVLDDNPGGAAVDLGSDLGTDSDLELDETRKTTGQDVSDDDF